MQRHFLLVALAAVGGMGFGLGPGGVLVGGGVMGLVVWGYGKALGALMGRGSRHLAMIFPFAKFLTLLGLGWLALSGTTHVPDPLGFAVGVTCFPVAVVWGTLRARGLDGTL